MLQTRLLVFLLFRCLLIADGYILGDDVSSLIDVEESGKATCVFSRNEIPSTLTNGWLKRPGRKRKEKPHGPIVLLPRPQELNLETAKTLAVFASISYCADQKSIQKWNCTRCEELPEFRIHKRIVSKSWDVTSYVGYYPPWNSKILVFRGTRGHDLKNWMENVKTMKHKCRINSTLFGYDKLRVHNGFSRIWNIPFKKSVLKAVKEMDGIYGKDIPLYVCGHSAGGATANLAAFTLKIVGNYGDVRLYTFGAPRVGNWEFASLITNLMSESWRFTHNRDPIPSLPLRSWGFWHCAQEVFQQEIEGVSKEHTITNYRISDGTGEDSLGHDSICPHGLGCNSINDHYFYLNTIMENDGTC